MAPRVTFGGRIQQLCVPTKMDMPDPFGRPPLQLWYRRNPRVWVLMERDLYKDTRA